VVLVVVVLEFAGGVSLQLAAFDADAPFLVQPYVTLVVGLEQLAARLTEPPLLGSEALDPPLTVATQPVGVPEDAGAAGTITVSGVCGTVTQAEPAQIDTW
jgi:hypothetical protein